MVENPDASTRFFKFILPPNDGQTKLRIPRKFARDYGHELSGIVKLTDPIGRIWRVRLKKIGDLLWLCDGWEKFANDHCLSHGYFLIISYKGNSTFNVHIFDLTTTEVDYTIPINEEISDDESNGKTCYLSSSSEELAGGVKTGRSYVVERTNAKGKCKIEDHRPSSSNGIEPSLSMKSQSRNKAGAKYLPKNPSYAVILEKNKIPYSLVFLPGKVSKHLGDPGPMELVDCDGEKWPVHIAQRSGRNYIDRYISAGWMRFVKQKKLEVGGTCVFELIDKNKRALKVSIFYNTSRH